MSSGCGLAVGPASRPGIELGIASLLFDTNRVSSHSAPPRQIPRQHILNEAWPEQPGQVPSRRPSPSSSASSGPSTAKSTYPPQPPPGPTIASASTSSTPATAKPTSGYPSPTSNAPTPETQPLRNGIGHIAASELAVTACAIRGRRQQRTRNLPANPTVHHVIHRGLRGGHQPGHRRAMPESTLVVATPSVDTGR